MSKKSRGINAERDLIHKFWKNNWAAIRSAGSGSISYPSPDIIASNGIRILSIECKLTTEEKKYFPKEEIKELKEFAKKFSSEPWIAIKFFRKEWKFISLEELKETNKSFLITKEEAEKKGLNFKELIE